METEKLENRESFSLLQLKIFSFAKLGDETSCWFPKTPSPFHQPLFFYHRLGHLIGDEIDGDDEHVTN